jgi:hypothetical protein
MVGIVGNAVFREVLSIESDTSMTLRTASTFSGTGSGRYKALILDPDDSVLTLDCLGKTADGETNGALLVSGPRMVESLLTDLGLADRLNAESFTEADKTAPQNLGLVFPETYNGSDTVTYRDVINRISKSIFGALTQNDALEIAYQILQPTKPLTATRFDESDILSWSFESTASGVVKTSIVEYQPREHDYLTGEESIRTKQKTSETATYLARSSKERVFTTALVDEKDADTYARRWAFLLENSAGRGTIKTKLQGIGLEVGSIIEVTHRKFFERYGLDSTSRLFFVEGVKKNGSDVDIQVVDLSSAFSRVAAIQNTTVTYDDATDREKLFGGYITDEYGLINNDPDSFGTNLIW